MKKLSGTLLSLLMSLGSPLTHGDTAEAQDCLPGLDEEAKRLHSSETINLCESFRNRPLLIVNTASYCGFTPQFESLEKIHKDYEGSGLAVIGFPSNDFHQESSLESETAAVCYKNYGVSFVMVAPVKVTGPNAHPIFKHLSDETSAPRWNFTKYLVNRDHQVVDRFGSNIEPDSAAMRTAIETVL